MISHHRRQLKLQQTPARSGAGGVLGLDLTIERLEFLRRTDVTLVEAGTPALSILLSSEPNVRGPEPGEDQPAVGLIPRRWSGRHADPAGGSTRRASSPS
jgi:hypothetical protein